MMEASVKAPAVQVAVAAAGFMGFCCSKAPLLP
jgi:hypothetical protein